MTATGACGASEVPGGMVAVSGDWVQLGPPQSARIPVPPGGRPGDSPTHRVWVSTFEIDQTEVTRAAYKDFLDATAYRPPYVDEAWARDDGWNWDGTDYPAGTGDHPVVLTSWHDATEYCRWAGKRLPSEAEWQLAALGPASQGNRYPWGKTYRADALNHGMKREPMYDESDGYKTTSPVGAFPAGRSPAGLLDAFGNAWEFTSDHRVTDWGRYSGRDADGDPSTPELADVRALGPGLSVAVRGGSYYLELDGNPDVEWSDFPPELRRKTSGFRCAR